MIFTSWCLVCVKWELLDTASCTWFTACVCRGTRQGSLCEHLCRAAANTLSRSKAWCSTHLACSCSPSLPLQHICRLKANPSQFSLDKHMLLFTQEITTKLNALFIHTEKQKALPFKISHKQSRIFTEPFKTTTSSCHQVGILWARIFMKTLTVPCVQVQ